MAGVLCALKKKYLSSCYSVFSSFFSHLGLMMAHTRERAGSNVGGITTITVHIVFHAAREKKTKIPFFPIRGSFKQTQHNTKTFVLPLSSRAPHDTRSDPNIPRNTHTNTHSLTRNSPNPPPAQQTRSRPCTNPRSAPPPSPHPCSKKA